MPIRYLDEEKPKRTIRYLDEPPAEKPKRRIRYLDEAPPAKPKRRIRYLDEEPLTPDAELRARLENPAYIPSKAEYQELKRLRAGDTFDLDNAAQIIKESFSQVFGDLKDASVAGAELAKQGRVKAIRDSMLEGLTRSAFDTAILTKKIGARIADGAAKNRIAQHGRPKGVARTRGGRVMRLSNRPSFPDVDLETLKAQVADQEYQRFVSVRKALAMRHLASTGHNNLLEEFLGQSNQIDGKLAEGGSYILDPVTLASSGLGAAGKGAHVVGSAVEAVGTGGVMAGGALKKGLTRLSDKIGTTAENVSGGAVKGQTAVTGAATIAAQASPTIAAASAAVLAAGPAGAGVQALGRSIKSQPGQVGVFEGLAKDAGAPPLSRNIGRGLSRLDGVAPAAIAAGQGAITGAATGAVLGGLADGPEGAAAGVGSSLAIGPIAAVAGDSTSRLTGFRKRQAEASDIANFRARLEKSPVSSPELFDRLPQSTKLQMATVQAAMPEVKIDLQDTDTFRAGLGSRESAAVAYFEPATGRIVINGSARDVHKNVMHELGHVIFNSPLVDKSLVTAELVRLYGQEGIKKLGAELIKERNRNPRTGAPLPDSEIKGLLNEQLLADPEFIVSELFSESVMDLTANEAFDAVRKGKPLKGEENGLRRAWVQTKGAVLSRLGLIPTESGALPPGTQFGNDVRLRFDSRFKRVVQKYIQDVALLNGRDALTAADKGTPISLQDLADSPAAGWERNAQGQLANDFAVLENGRVRPKTREEIQNHLDQRRRSISGALTPSVTGNPELRIEAFKELFNTARVETDPTVPTMALRPDGKIRGTILPDEVFSLDSLSPEQRSTLRTIQDSISGGDTYSSWYTPIGSSERNWARDVAKRQGNIKVKSLHFKPLEFQITKSAGNINIVSLDVQAVRHKYAQWAKDGKLSLWNDSASAFEADMQTYLGNHRAGRPGGEGLGPEKKDRLNAFFNASRKANPLTSVLNNKRESLIKSYRVDRMHTLRPQDTSFYFDYGKVKENFRTMPQRIQ